MLEERTKKERKDMTKNNEKNALRNINGLSEGDRAYCGKYGIITCTKRACRLTKSPRKFKVAKSSVLRNGGNWSYRKLREAINS